LRLKFLFYAAAVSIGLAGIQHLIDLVIDPEHSGNISIAAFFIIAGVAQIFWALPTAKRWTRSWHYVGIAGNAVLIVLWSLTRMPNPITGGEAEPINEIGITVQLLQVSYIALIATAIIRQKHMMKIDPRMAADAA
jgi:hypothetical protein